MLDLAETLPVMTKTQRRRLKKQAQMIIRPAKVAAEFNAMSAALRQVPLVSPAYHDQLKSRLVPRYHPFIAITANHADVERAMQKQLEGAKLSLDEDAAIAITNAMQLILAENGMSQQH